MCASQAQGLLFHQRKGIGFESFSLHLLLLLGIYKRYILVRQQISDIVTQTIANGVYFSIVEWLNGKVKDKYAIVVVQSLQIHPNS